MPHDEQPAAKTEARILNFRRNRPAGRAADASSGQTFVKDLSRYERPAEGAGGSHDDYRHRMIVNVAALVFIIALIATGYWLADSMAHMRKNQDCVLSGRRGCTPIEVAPGNRW